MLSQLFSIACSQSDCFSWGTGTEGRWWFGVFLGVFFGAVLVSVRLRGMTGCRGPVVASLWQKWGFHARLGANAVLLIWPASKGLEGTRSPPAPPLFPLWFTPAPPALLGSFPSCLGPPCTSKRNNAAASLCRPHPPCIQPLLTPCHPLFTLLSLFSNTLNMWIIILEQFHDQNTPPFSPTLLIFIHLVCELLTRLCLSFFLRSRVLILKTEQRERVPLFLVFESYVFWQHSLKLQLQTLAAESVCGN